MTTLIISRIRDWIAFGRDFSAFGIDAILTFTAAWGTHFSWNKLMVHWPVIRSAAANPQGVLELISNAPDPLALGLAYLSSTGQFMGFSLLAIVLGTAAIEGFWSALRRI